MILTTIFKSIKETDNEYKEQTLQILQISNIKNYYTLTHRKIPANVNCDDKISDISDLFN